MLDHQQFDHSPEFVDGDAVDIQLLDQIVDDFVTEDQGALRRQEHLIDGLEYDLLHRREVEILDRELCAVLNIYAQMNLFLVIVLHAEDEAEIQSVLVSILLHDMDQVIEHC